MEEDDMWGYPKLGDVLSLSWSNGRRHVRVPHTVANRYGIPFPTTTRHEEKSVKAILTAAPRAHRSHMFVVNLLSRGLFLAKENR
ncbi:hypothetical protein LF916_00480 [Bifidobacterium pseudolongum]|uniref:hypothetical protein n=1 Tax=Bifidobacterium pseudolongum TaxID=1694 RepID=UPI001F0E0F7D|nr:hypothetical protein [Bifidobacterium pseudolongum]MCH4859379.1 hypothetical protein [Bifidobacterium pseudolongum]MCH4861150.1 hypothetical protein [Bifidobacterium pseudolongum]